MRYACEIMLVKSIPKSTVQAPISKTTPGQRALCCLAVENESVAEGLHKPLGHMLPIFSNFKPMVHAIHGLFPHLAPCDLTKSNEDR
jgi:hypothetical protein